MAVTVGTLVPRLLGLLLSHVGTFCLDRSQRDWAARSECCGALKCQILCVVLCSQLLRTCVRRAAVFV
jgi:hypothetical protein